MSNKNIDEGSPLVFNSNHIPPVADKRTHTKKTFAIWSILISVGFERLAFHSLVGNLVLFLTSDAIRWTSVNSIIASFIFYGSSYISAIIFSWISDAKLGRAKTILIGFILYFTGYIFIPLFSKAEIFENLCGASPAYMAESTSYFSEICSGRITAALVINAIGVGTVQANMAILGAEQIKDEKSTAQYFYKYYAAVNTGGFLALSVIAYIQQNKSYFIGYVISTALLVVALIVFLIGYRCYIHIKPHGSIITYVFPVLINAFQTKRKHQSRSRKILNERKLSKSSVYDDDDKYANHVYVASDSFEQQKTFLDYARSTNEGRFQDRIVNDVKSLKQIIAMFIILMPYWLVYLQSDTTFILQGVHMKIPVFKSHISRMPIVWLSLTDQIIIILTILILNTYICERLHINNRLFSIKIRMVIGMIFAAFSMCMTGIVEIVRQKLCASSFQQIIGNTVYNVSNMSIFYQFPQYISMGLSEVFTSVASFEFAYLVAPRSAQSLAMSVRFCSIGLSSFIGYGYIKIYENIDANFTLTNLECKNVKKSELSYVYFFVLSAIQLIFIFIFLGCDRKFRILKASKNQSLFITAQFDRTKTSSYT